MVIWLEEWHYLRREVQIGVVVGRDEPCGALGVTVARVVKARSE
jgi:hypothetical protein